MLSKEHAKSEKRIVVNGEQVEEIEEFAHLHVGASVDKKGGGSRNIRNRLQKACGAFQRLRKV